MGIKLLFFTGFSKFVAHESVAFMFVLFSCYSRCLLIFFLGGGIRGQSENPVSAPYYTEKNIFRHGLHGLTRLFYVIIALKP